MTDSIPQPTPVPALSAEDHARIQEEVTAIVALETNLAAKRLELSRLQALVEEMETTRHDRYFAPIRGSQGVLFETYFSHELEQVRQRQHVPYGVAMVPVDYFDIRVGQKELSVAEALEMYLAGHAVLWLPLEGTDQQLHRTFWINPATLEVVREQRNEAGEAI
jgi:hypothetical protein